MQVIRSVHKAGPKKNSPAFFILTHFSYATNLVAVSIQCFGTGVRQIAKFGNQICNVWLPFGLSPEGRSNNVSDLKWRKSGRSTVGYSPYEFGHLPRNDHRRDALGYMVIHLMGRCVKNDGARVSTVRHLVMEGKD